MTIQEANELKDRMDKRKDQMTMMINILYEKSYEFSEYNNIIKKAKANLEKLGCGKEYYYHKYCTSMQKCGWSHRHKLDGTYPKDFCKNCQKEKEILEGILK